MSDEQLQNTGELAESHSGAPAADAAGTEATPTPAPFPVNGEGEPEATDTGTTQSGTFALCRVTPELAAVVGDKPLTRMKITQKLWEYIKLHSLQDPDNRRNINADEQLRAVFGKDVVSMFEIPKLLNRHIEETQQKVKVPRQAKKPKSGAPAAGAAGKKKHKNKVGAPAAGADGTKKPKSGAPAAVAAGKPVKQASLINATQSELLKKRMEQVKQKQLDKCDPDERPNRTDDSSTPEDEFIIEAVRSGRLVLKSGDALRAAVMDLFAEGEAEFNDNFRTKSVQISISYPWRFDFALLFENPQEVRVLEQEFEKADDERKAVADGLKKAVRRVVERIQRAIASGTNTGAEVTAMIDEFEQMEFGEASRG